VPKHRRNGAEPNELRTRRGIRNEERWDEILRAAGSEFSERGYHASRLQDIAARVGLLTGSLYYYIESKEDLLFSLAESSMQLAIDATLEDEATAHSDASTRLRAFIQRQMEVYHSLQSPSGGIWREVAWLSDEHHAQIESMRRTLNGFVRQIIQQGLDEGTFDPQLDAGLAASSLFALLSTTRGWAINSRRSLSEIGDWYARLLVRGLTRREHLDTLPPAL
jgi:AcrR family transcriptional regulator